MAEVELEYLDKIRANDSSLELEREEHRRTRNVRLPSSMGGKAVQLASMEVESHVYEPLNGVFSVPTPGPGEHHSFVPMRSGTLA